MAFSIEQILGWENLTGLIQETVSGVPDEQLPPAFFTTKKTTVGNTGTYTQVKGNRQTARLVQYGAPALRRNLREVADRPVVLMHTFEELQFNPLTLQKLRSYNSYENTQGKEEVTRQIEEFGRYFGNLRISAVMSMLFKGAIYFDSDGNLLPNSSGALTTIDYGIPAGNKNQLDALGAGAIIAASWATTSTDIPAHLRGLRQAARRLTGYKLTNAFYGKAIPGYFAANTLVQAYLSRGQMVDKYQKFLDTGEIPAGLFGFNWIPTYESFFNDQNDTSQSFVADDAVAFTPEIAGDVYELMEGTYMVPRSLDVLSGGLAAMGAVESVTGTFSYARVIDNPVTVVARMGDTFLPVWKVPNALFIADVVP